MRTALNAMIGSPRAAAAAGAALGLATSAAVWAFAGRSFCAALPGHLIDAAHAIVGAL